MSYYPSLTDLFFEGVSNEARIAKEVHTNYATLNDVLDIDKRSDRLIFIEADGNYYRWDQTLNGGLGDWEVAINDASGTIISASNVGTGAGKVYKQEVANNLEFKSIQGTANRVSVVNNASDVTLSVPQDIHTGATTTFANVVSSNPASINTHLMRKGEVDSAVSGVQSNLTTHILSTTAHSASNITASAGTNTFLTAPQVQQQLDQADVRLVADKLRMDDHTQGLAEQHPASDITTVAGTNTIATTLNVQGDINALDGAVGTLNNDAMLRANNLGDVVDTTMVLPQQNLKLRAVGDATAITAGELMIGNTTTGVFNKATLTGTLNQINVANADGSITLSTPQNLHEQASVIFNRVTLNQPPSNDHDAVKKIWVEDQLDNLVTSSNTELLSVTNVSTAQNRIVELDLKMGGGEALLYLYRTTTTNPQATNINFDNVLFSAVTECRVRYDAINRTDTTGYIEELLTSQSDAIPFKILLIDATTQDHAEFYATSIISVSANFITFGVEYDAPNSTITGGGTGPNEWADTTPVRFFMVDVQREITSGTGVSVVESNPKTITISTDGNEVTNGANTAVLGATIFKDKTGQTLNFKRISTTGLNLLNNTDDVAISATATTVPASNAGHTILTNTSIQGQLDQADLALQTAGGGQVDTITSTNTFTLSVGGTATDVQLTNNVGAEHPLLYGFETVAGLGTLTTDNNANLALATTVTLGYLPANRGDDTYVRNIYQLLDFHGLPARLRVQDKANTTNFAEFKITSSVGAFASWYQFNITYDAVASTVSTFVNGTAVYSYILPVNKQYQAGTNITIDQTDPEKPIINASGGPTVSPFTITNGTYPYNLRLYGYDGTLNLKLSNILFNTTFNVIANDFVRVTLQARMTVPAGTFAGSELTNRVFFNVPLQGWLSTNTSNTANPNSNQRCAFHITGSVWGLKQVTSGLYTNQIINYFSGIENLFQILETYSLAGDPIPITGADLNGRTLEFFTNFTYQCSSPQTLT